METGVQIFREQENCTVGRFCSDLHRVPLSPTQTPDVPPLCFWIWPKLVQGHCFHVQVTPRTNSQYLHGLFLCNWSQLTLTCWHAFQPPIPKNSSPKTKPYRIAWVFVLHTTHLMYSNYTTAETDKSVCLTDYSLKDRLSDRTKNSIIKV